MTDTEWYWAESDGTPKLTSIVALQASFSMAALPAFVLLWHTGLGEWLPAYLMNDFAKVLGVEEVDKGELDPSLTTPPPAPVEWYIECYGGTAPVSLAEPMGGMSETQNMNIGAQFDPQQMKTVLGRNKPLPVGAFRSVDDYLGHIRALREKG